MNNANKNLSVGFRLRFKCVVAVTRLAHSFILIPVAAKR